MKKLLLLLGICAITFSSCGGHDKCNAYHKEYSKK